MRTPSILVLNCGSSSIKFAILSLESVTPVFSGLVEKLGTAEAALQWSTADSKQSQALGQADYQSALNTIFETLDNLQLTSTLSAVGHRVVHGGEAFTKATRIDKAVLETLESCNNLAPLHNPANLLGVRIATEQRPDLPQVAVFDTAFHQSMPEHAYIYALPYALYRDHKIRRYGFHGTSHRYVTEKAAEQQNKDYHNSRWISAHLGNGCSGTAVINGQSVETTMGFTPLEGLVMGTRSGNIDPGLMLHLMETLNLSASDLSDMLNKQSGLLGISELSMDMRTLKKHQTQQPQAKLAIEVFCYQLAKQLASLMVPLGHVDGLIFTGGIGENDAGVRARTLEWLEHLNFHVDSEKNITHGKNTGGIITKQNSLPALVIQTQEEWMIAQDTWQTLNR